MNLEWKTQMNLAKTTSSLDHCLNKKFNESSKLVKALKGLSWLGFGQTISYITIKIAVSTFD